MKALEYKSTDPARRGYVSWQKMDKVRLSTAERSYDLTNGSFRGKKLAV